MPSRVFAALGSDPLIFVDGERVEGPPRDILESYSRDDIESIEIIKGPYAMTLYGDEAVNGVIVIVLK
jgi:TonB-dependent SusC/RagA subfamily outer membrane receptor